MSLNKQTAANANKRNASVINNSNDIKKYKGIVKEEDIFVRSEVSENFNKREEKKTKTR